MFTGIIEALGKVVSLKSVNDGKILTLILPFSKEDLGIGNSISVNGACLTLTNRERGCASFFLSQMTLKTSNLGGLIHGDWVNLERPLRLNQELGGHLITGHIDTISTIEEIKGEHVRFFLPEELKPFTVDKGSIAVDGISLTIAQLFGDSFTVSIIPHTRDNTTIQYKKKGDRVNIEVDLLSKYVLRILTSDILNKPKRKGEELTNERLLDYGYL